MSNEIVKVENNDLPIKSMADLADVGSAIAKSGMFGVNSDSAGMVLAMTCYQERITPLDFTRTYHIIQNKPTMKSDAMLAKFSEMGGDYKILARTNDKAELYMKFKTREHQDSITWEEVQNESYVFNKDGKTLKDNWSTPRRRKQMLWARLVSDMIHVVAPEVNCGIYTPDEIDGVNNSFTESTQEVEVDPNKANEALGIKTKTTKKAEPAKDDVVDVKASEVVDNKQPAQDTQGQKLFKEAEKKKAAAEKVDVTVCPISSVQAFYNVKWADFDNLKTLESCLNASKKGKYPEVTDGHIAELEKEIAKRKEAKAGA